ncbi:MAG: phospho-N-acetylmuramoyl-pentapeptide-transferase, partial [Actinobacteria bacterium]|nr:phospho-N-acetylmuramoyl-pentapeptide-transferase [Actinomycetota bacterium]
WIFLSIIISGIISVFMTIFLINFQKKRHIGKSIRSDGPKSHSTKAGTPTMGGIVFIIAGGISYIIVSLIKYYRHNEFNLEGIFALSIFILCGIIGFIDDFIGFKKHRNLGLRGWVKIGLLIIVCIYFILFSRFVLHFPTTIGIPFTNHVFDIGYWYYLIVIFIILFATNAVNLTDGLDGLAAGTSSIVLSVFILIAFLEWTVSNIKFDIDLAVLCGGAVAACIGFLWWNTSPAEIFMGDTGAFSLGGLIAAIAILLKQEILLLVIGGIFVVEALSVVIQVIWYKSFKRRVFKMAPIHHHFELLGWPEVKVITRFWVVCFLFAGTGFFIYYIKFLK